MGKERAARKEREELGCKKECWLGVSSSVKSFRVEGFKHGLSAEALWNRLWQDQLPRRGRVLRVPPGFRSSKS